MKLLFSYESDKVDGPSLDMIVRSDSEKMEININRKLFVYILHRGELFFWMECGEVGTASFTTRR